MSNTPQEHVVVIGAGPAGLTAAYQLGAEGIGCDVIEKSSHLGGLSRTGRFNGYRFDIGGHRFFTKVEAVEALWREVLPDGEMLRRKRVSRIYYDKRFFHYPLRFGSTLSGLGLFNGALILASYLRARISPSREEKTFEQWVSNRFGRRLYRIFFKTYTEKVWGIPCNEITAEWAAQRIKDLSLPSALRNAILGSRNGTLIRTLIDEFDYPRHGPGMLWERMASLACERGSTIHFEHGVERVRWEPGRVVAVDTLSPAGRESFGGSHFISSMPIRELIARMDPMPPTEVVAAASRLGYRDFITVLLVVDKPDLFPDNWIYVHDPGVRLARVQNFKNWSPEMVPDPSKSSLGLEYFCFEGDGLWRMPDDEILELATRELEQVGLARRADVEDGIVVRVPKAYPVYDSTYREALSVIRDFLRPLANLQLVGRNGMHRYNNQDHSMLTAMLAVRNILGANYDLWSVNADEEYHEEITPRDRDLSDAIAKLASTQPLVPERIVASSPTAQRTTAPPTISVILPAYNASGFLDRSLGAVLSSTVKCEVIVVDDRSSDDTVERARRMGATVVELPERAGPAAARNAGARVAHGEILFFVDADVVVQPTTLERVLETFERSAEVAAIFGSYDDRPADPGFVSQYKNLHHHYIHQQSNGQATTFWAGCGAVRRDAFESVGGFDVERFPHPSIEDIELGYRLRSAGHEILLDHELQVTHLKRWTLGSLIHTDIFRRAAPWTRLNLERAVAVDDLNLSRNERLSAGLVAVSVLGLPLAPLEPMLAPLGLGALAAVPLVNRSLYRFLARQRGIAFAALAFPMQILYYLYSGTTYVVVTADYMLRKRSRRRR